MSIAQHPASSPSPGGVRALSRVVNPIVAQLAGRRFMPLYGLLKHRGRRSGRLFQTPVVVQRTADGFLVPMPWGEGTDWYRNVRAAGGCVIRFHGRDYPVDQPELIATARSSFNGLERAAMSRLGIAQALHLRYPR
ncbi:MAG: nitroreductase family deazaflavin-dependent oxidoreductase [Chloroflexi bacterium]|nr:nitroreductase family deazaflavin-dependent oxidoreductase [Chloroflexota bacterium]